MLTLPLDPTDDRANPVFKDAAGCAQWLGQLQLTNLHLAHGVLRTQLDELNRYPMRGLERLHTLELLRETVSSIQTDYARKLFAAKLPLSTDELTVFVSIIGLWQGMVTGYQRCLQAYMAGDARLAQHGALLCQRCLLYSGLQIFEHLRTGYEFDGKLWHQLHELYAFSEEQGLQLAEVADSLNGNTRPTSCRAAYAKLLLACHAYRAELTRNQLQLLDRWLTLWSPTITVERSYTMSKGDASPLAVDLSGLQGLQPLQQVNPSGNVRYLAMVPLSKLLRVKMILLQQGQSPQQLELGEGCNSAECAWFLNYLHQYWCEERGDRMPKRGVTQKQAQMCYGIESCFAYVANKPFKQPDKGASENAQQIQAFGRVLSDTDRHDLSGMGFALETWQIKDESILGARLLREEITGMRLGPNQLVAVRPSYANAFMLGAVSWVKVAQTGQLHAGVRYLPGSPQAITMSTTGINLAVSDKSVAALLLPAVPALKTPASLIAPRDWFKPGRIVEIVQTDKAKLDVKMEFSVEKGSDYERISFSQA
ncbi:MAG: hypothetical protein KGJ19_03725 [Betaproteobacteria bacterium]|nr:hypothetical protein [Betaproteobacteria bacterium]